MLKNAYFLAKIGVDTAENEQHFADILPTDALGHEPLRPPREARYHHAPRWAWADNRLKAAPSEPALQDRANQQLKLPAS